ncbi:MAG: hypothetical protein A3A51_00115 [Candidatus Levybacteria bacterium RIFCSPLOWO2_01_FULL_39_10]|nr:MAG: hypothetical protein A3A51_00115 [Candidatus Levybacteria bacterium RIFCSPLOWO2_01_FULL_39_10]
MSKYSRKKIYKKVGRLIRRKGLEILLIFLIVIASFLSGILFNKLNSLEKNITSNSPINFVSSEDLSKIQNKVLKDKYIFKIKWGDLGKRMVEDGVIDKVKLAQAIGGEDELPKDLDKYFTGDQNKIEVNQGNAQFWVDVLWGLGLANKNKILEEGDMMMEDDASIFASTGGWSLGAGDPMDHYSRHSYITLSEEQQKTVSEIAGSIYRPCCGNSTAFPDCNHGMAMLGLIELMVSQNFSKDEIYKTALAFNTYWFPQTYLDSALYLQKNGKDYEKVSPKELLSENFSSAMGSQTISEEVGQVQWPAFGNGGSCGA